MAFPRVARNRRRAREIERVVEEELRLSKFQGLTSEQRDAVLKVIDEHSTIRWRTDGTGHGGKKPIVETTTSTQMPSSSNELPSDIGTIAEQDSQGRASLANKYSPQHLLTSIDRQTRNSAVTTSIQEKGDREEDPLMNNMINVTHSLQTWVHTILDAPVSLDPSNPSLAVQPTPEPDIPRTNSLTSHGAIPIQSEPSAIAPPTSTREDDQFNVLLRALDTSIKPTSTGSDSGEYRPSMIVSNVVDGMRDGRMAGLFDDDVEERGRKRRNAAPSRPDRTKYGAWYIKPTHWEVFMKRENERKQKKPEEKKVGSLVQAKLAAIIALRAKEEARLAEDVAAQSSSVDSDSESVVGSDDGA
ncbi:hypothetical protein HK097_000900 [Rhizophlyctis rosea]|uniref:Uncharacterized protein n=1 Tax=Rhizophlyctis rosea TaxID=64517 RepID=A0AAD5S6R7_9FUNG|nr:hypothetical protein HK097_000900 [Rhizophlyctis rosea]